MLDSISQSTVKKEELELNGIHDMGGMHGLGKVEVEKEEPVFHSDWERSVFVMMVSTLGNGLYNLDEFRHAIERMHPSHYLLSRYYEHWLNGLVANLVSKGIITGEELDKRFELAKSGKIEHSERKDPELTGDLMNLVKSGGSTSREISGSPRFKVGDRIVTRNINPPGHTRLPRYVRGKAGVVEIVHKAFVLPDMNAHGKGENPEYVYSVRFDGHEVWGDSTEKGEALHVDLWESYLEGGGTKI